MTLYNTPGVYIEIYDRSQYVSSSGSHVAAFVIVAPKGPINEVRKIFSWDQAVRVYGRYELSGHLDMLNIKKFFEEGGNIAYINGICHYDSSGTMQAVAASYMMQDAKLGNNKTANDDIKLYASSPKTWGNDLSVKNCTKYTTTTAAFANGANNIDVNSTSSFELGDKITISDGVNKYTTIITAIDSANKKLYFPAATLSASINSGADVKTASVHKVYTSLADGQTLSSNATQIDLRSTAGINVGAIITVVDTRTTNPNYVNLVVKSINGKTIAFDSVGTITSIDAVNSRVMTQEFNLYTYYKGELRDVQRYLSPLQENAKDNIETKMASSYLDINADIQTNTADAIDLIPEPLIEQSLSGGVDGISGLTSSDYIGDQALKTGLYAFDGINDIDVFVIPGTIGEEGGALGTVDPVVQHGLINYLENHYQFSRCYLATPQGLSVQEAIDYKRAEGASTNPAPFASHLASLHYPWEKEVHPITGKTVYIPQDVLMAGRMARSWNRTFPWYAVAGPRRTISTCLGLEIEVGDTEDGQLQDNNINCTRRFDEGIYVNGEKSLANIDSRLDRNHNVDCVNWISKKLRKVLQYMKFEPNTPDTWRSVVKLVTPLLQFVKDNDGLYSYEVICNRDTTTKYNIDNSEMYCDIILETTQMAEKIVNRLTLVGTQSSFTRL